MKFTLVVALIAMCACAEALSQTRPPTRPPTTTTTKMPTRSWWQTIGCWFTTSTEAPTTTTTPGPPTTTTTTPAPLVNLGCFVDKKGNSRSLLNNDSRMQSDALTPEMCRDYCAEEGFSFAGTKNGQYCFCGNSDNYAKLGTSTGCTRPCLGDADQTCGGRRAIQVYATGN